MQGLPMSPGAVTRQLWWMREMERHRSRHEQSRCESEQGRGIARQKRIKGGELSLRKWGRQKLYCSYLVLIYIHQWNNGTSN
jgi:hypothetical protein